MAQTLEERIIQVLVEQLGVEESQVKPEAHLQDDLGADSLDSVEIIMAFEDDFAIEISDEDGETLKTVRDIQDYLRKNTKHGRG